MNSYPDDYIVHNLPLVILTGLELTVHPETPSGEKSFQFLGDGGFRIRNELPPLHHPLTSDLRTALLSHDASKAAWRSQSSDKADQASIFKVRSIGRSYTFPPRKAPPPPHSPRLRPANDNGLSPPPLTLHSTLSPLTPSSPLYPDGIITPLWITKHQYRLPSVLVSFYNLVADAGTSSLEDNKIKNEVNSIRTLITSTNHKTKFVLVLVADGPINNAELEERLVNIRRGTSFDSKALYYLPNTSSPAEMSDFAKVLFATLHPTCIEYYRDLSKHARRKRNRNAVPQPTIAPTAGTSSALPLQGWNVRYEFKLGIFAETRQELEAASRNYEQAYEGLFHAELFESIPAWSSRFDEARMLADVIAIRLIRCALWSSRTADAVKWWLKHKDRIGDLIDRRGKGTENYGWESWQSIWTRTMADLIERAEVFVTVQLQLPPGSSLPIQIALDKTSASIDRRLPFESLHHEGYWLNLVGKHIERRRRYAEQIPPEDIFDITSSTSKGKKTSSLYDTYLTPEPKIERLLLGKDGETYAKRTCDVLTQASKLFQARDQHRMIESLRYRQAVEQRKVGDWLEMISISKPWWRQSTWRQHGWWNLLSHVSILLLEAAIQVEDYELCILLLLEQSPTQQVKQNTPKGLESKSLSTAIDLNACLTHIVPSIAFATIEGHVGEPAAMQLSLHCSTDFLPVNLQIREVKLVFDGGIHPVMLKTLEAERENQEPLSTRIQDVDLHSIEAVGSTESKRLSLTGGSCWAGSADLRLVLGHSVVLDFEIIPHEAGPVSVASIRLLLSNGLQELTLHTAEPNQLDPTWWEARGGCAVGRPFGMQRDVTTMVVLPKPPKIEIGFPNLGKSYYTNENVVLQIELENGEDRILHGELQVSPISPSQNALKIRWADSQKSNPIPDDDIQDDLFSPKQISNLAVGAKVTPILHLSGLNENIDHELDISFSYTLGADITKLTKQVFIDLPVVRPFEANASFAPRLHTNVWPDFFAAPDVGSAQEARGLKQKYLVKADVGCFAHEPLEIQSLKLVSRRIVGDAVCNASIGRSKISQITLDSKTTMQPDKTEHFFFDLELQKLVLGDRSPVALEFSIDVTWSRVGSGEVNILTIPLPKFIAPMAEPRVLLEVIKNEGFSGTYLLTYTIENPSMHFLTFNMSMDSGEGFAFSGSKTKAVSLVPLSRYTMHYRVFSEKHNEWLRVHLDVLDAFFGQTLKVQPASEGLRTDKQGNVQIWTGD